MLGVSKSTAYNLVNSGAIQAIRVNGLVLIPAEAVDRLLKKNDC